MPTYIGLVKYRDAGVQGERELEVGRHSRTLAERHGGRILSIYWTNGDNRLIIAFEGRGEEQAANVFNDLSASQNVEVDMVRALTEGEKERAICGRAV